MIYLRKATIDDMKMIYDWANDPVTRASSFQTEPIPWETHVAWFKRTLEREDALIYVLMDDNAPVGQARATITEGIATVANNIAPDQRGKGYGTWSLTLLTPKVLEDYSGEIHAFISEVKPDNVASIKNITRSGYHFVEENEKEQVYRIDIGPDRKPIPKSSD